MIRTARMDKVEIEALNQLIALSARGLSQREYTSEQIEGLIEHVFGVDTELIEDKTYYVIEEECKYLACGGWSRRKTLFGGNQCVDRERGYLDPKTDAAKIRAFFVHPDHARKGLGKTLLDHCEKLAKKSGFSRIEMMATLPGVNLYKVYGYQMNLEEKLMLPNGLEIPLIKMSKDI